MGGWVKLSRDVTETELWKAVVPFRLFLLLNTQATREDGRMVNGIQLKKRQYIRAYSKLAEDLGYREGRGEKQYSKSTIKRAVDKLVKKQLISVEETPVGTLFTLVSMEEIQTKGFVNYFYAPFRETKSEPSRNEEETKPEQKQEREKKKEKKEKREDATRTITEGEQQENAEIGRKTEKLIERFIQLRKKDASLTANDRCSIETLAKQEIPLEQLLTWMDVIHEDYSNTYPLQNITSMKYYEAAIMTRVAKGKTKRISTRTRKESLEERMARLEHEGMLG